MDFKTAIRLLDEALLCESSKCDATKDDDLDKLLLNCAWEYLKKQFGITNNPEDYKNTKIIVQTTEEHNEGLTAIFSALLHELKTEAESIPYNKEKNVTYDRIKIVLLHRLAIEAHQY